MFRKETCQMMFNKSSSFLLQVQCAVRLRYSVGSVPGPFIQSQVFAAGLYVIKF